MFSEYIIYKLLKGSWGSFESKWHDFELILSSGRSRYAECSDFLALICHRNLMIATSEVHCRDDTVACNLFHQFVLILHDICLSFRVFVDIPEVEYYSEFSILF